MICPRNDSIYTAEAKCYQHFLWIISSFLQFHHFSYYLTLLCRSFQPLTGRNRFIDSSKHLYKTCGKEIPLKYKERMQESINQQQCQIWSNVENLNLYSLTFNNISETVCYLDSPLCLCSLFSSGLQSLRTIDFHFSSDVSHI